MAWLFNKKGFDKFLSSEEFVKLSRQGVEFTTAIDILKGKMDRVETEHRSLRAKINNHILQDPEIEEEIKKEKQESIKTGMFLADNGIPFHR